MDDMIKRNEALMNFNQLHASALAASHKSDHAKAAQLFLQTASAISEIDPAATVRYTSSAVEELARAGDFEQAHKLLQTLPSEDTPDARFAREVKLARYCINIESAEALEHLSRAQELTPSCTSPKTLLVLVHSEFHPLL